METLKENKRERPQVLSIEKIEHEWQLLTEALKREIASDENIRKALFEFSSRAISETFASDLFSRLSENSRLMALLTRYRESLDTFLGLPVVSEERITPDLQNAQLSDQEKLIAGVRYRFARDLKMLCLSAELLDHPISAQSRGQEVILPSGIRVMMDANYSEESLELLNPAIWEKRKQLKDRVYEVTANGHKYILKERKTPKHEHQKEGGYKETLSSFEEFSIAKELNEKARVNYDNIQVDFEKPVGYVEFPDGFEFVIFEHSAVAKSRKPEDEYYNAPEIREALEKKILEKRADFEAEYKAVANLAEQDFLYRENMRCYESSMTEAALLLITKVLGKQFRPVKLGFEDFMKVKAFRMLQQAEELLVASYVALGYSNTDHDGFAYVVPEQDDVALKVVGYDFEYYKPRVNNNDTLMDYRSRLGKYLYGESRYRTLFYRRIPLSDQFNRIQGAAVFALLHLEQEKLKSFADREDLDESEEDLY